MSEDAECNMGSRVRETGMSRPWVGKGEWGGAKTKSFACPGCLTLLNVGSVWKSGCKYSRGQAPLQTDLHVSHCPKGSSDVCPVLFCPIYTLHTPRGASTQPCGAWGRTHHCQLTQPLGSWDQKFKTSPTSAFHSAKQELNMSLFIFQSFCAF